MGGIPLKTIVQTVGILALVGLFIYVGQQGKRLAETKHDLEIQVAETKACNESVGELETAVNEQTQLAEEYRIASEAAEGLYNELAAREPETRIVPRERIVEVVRPGDCDRAALDAWDLLHGGNASWGPTGPTVNDWVNFYASAPVSAWGVEPVPAHPYRVNEFVLYATPSRFPMQAPPLNGEGIWISGYSISSDPQ